MSLASGATWQLAIDRTWDGTPLLDGEQSRVTLGVDPCGLTISVSAPWAGDPLPQRPRGPCPRLWEHEVVEVFLAAEGEEYLEIEMGPGGHHLVLALRGIRRTTATELPLELSASTAKRAFVARAVVAWELVPPGLSRGNATRIWGQGAKRTYASHVTLGGAVPDFHQLDRFMPVPKDFLAACRPFLVPKG